MKTIKEIFDNELTLSCDKWNNYFGVYEFYLNKFVQKNPVVVEVGVQKGGSLQMWSKYFGEGSKITGIDIDKNVLTNVPHYTFNIDVVIGDQSNPMFWDDFLAKNPKIDIFIDDGSHNSEHQKITFEKVFPLMAPGSVYICEDTHCSWMGRDGNPFVPNSFMQYIKTMIDALYCRHINEIENSLYLPPSSISIDENMKKMIDLCKNLHGINVYESMVVFTKYDEQEMHRVFPKNI